MRTSLGVTATAVFIGIWTLTASPTHATGVNILDNYWGGENTWNAGDVIGPANVFDISQASVLRSGSKLQVIISTNYAGVPGTAAADGTGYGALFLSPGVWTPSGSAADHYSADQYQAGDWAYAFTMPTTPGTQSGTGNLYSTAQGNVVQSNVNNNFITYPHQGNPGYYFRAGQAVQFNPNADATSLAGGSWMVDALNHTITFTINDLNPALLTNQFALAWAMTCGNDVIQGQVDFGSNGVDLGTGDVTETPLPAALPLFASGIGALGLVGWRRKQKAASTA